MEPGIYEGTRKSTILTEFHNARGGNVQAICYGPDEFTVYVKSPTPHLESMSKEEFRSFACGNKDKRHISVWMRLKNYKTFRTTPFPDDYIKALKHMYDAERAFLVSLGYDRTFVWGFGASWIPSYMVLEDLNREEE